jgi:hypothetical protein
MPGISTFDSTKELLPDVLKSVREGKTQLPDFQRGWIWDDDHIKSLLASISLSYPIGAVMMLETGSSEVRFRPRLVEGVVMDHPASPERFILDGQQRLTALFQSLYSGKVVETTDSRNNPIKRWYYLDIGKALGPNGDFEEAIVGLPEDRLVRNFRGEVQADYSTLEKECAAEFLPLSIVFDTVALTNWQMKYLQADPARLPERLERWNVLLTTVIQRFLQYQIPVIILRKDTPKEAVCQVFEKVNTGGVPLTVFELLTATYAADDFNLREDWEKRQKTLRQKKVLGSIESSDFLQAVTLLATRAKRLAAIDQGSSPGDTTGISCKRKDILKLSLAEYQTWADAVTKGFERAAKLLFSQKLFSARDLPYRTQLTPLAAILTILGDKAEHDGVRNKLARWYWCGVFGELYGGSIETRFAKDLPEVLSWVDGGPEPATIVDANFAPARLLTLRTRNSAAYKGLYAILMRDGGLDFRSGEPIDVQTYFDDKIDIHHIFPQDWCKGKPIDPRRADSIVNKTPLAARTNRIIGNDPPSKYLARLQKHAGIEEVRMDDILRSHVIEPAHVRADDFDTFFQAREAALLARIENAMGKPIAREAMPEPTEAVSDYQEDEENAA